MKILIGSLILLLIIQIFILYAGIWGQNHCKKAGGNWISMDGGKHCVDNNFKEIDIYK